MTTKLQRRGPRQLRCAPSRATNAWQLDGVPGCDCYNKAVMVLAAMVRAMKPLNEELERLSNAVAAVLGSNLSAAESKLSGLRTGSKTQHIIIANHNQT